MLKGEGEGSDVIPWIVSLPGATGATNVLTVIVQGALEVDCDCFVNFYIRLGSLAESFAGLPAPLELCTVTGKAFAVCHPRQQRGPGDCVAACCPLKAEGKFIFSGWGIIALQFENLWIMHLQIPL